MSAVSIHEAVAISFASQSDCGKVRKENQDSILHATVPLGDLLIVADGIGGYAGGGIASQMAVDVFSSTLAGMPTFFPPAIAIREAACRANAEIATMAAQPGTVYNRMGTTIVMALLQQDPERPNAPVQAWIGHIGDSRAYLLRRGRLIRLTRDHSAMQLLIDRNLITPEEARFHPDSSVLTRSLGHELTVEIELSEITLEPGDTLLLCSDGLWGFVSEKEIARVLADRTLSVGEASRALLNLALDAGGHDNVGIELARLAGTSKAVDVIEPAVVPESSQAPVAQSALEPVLASIPVAEPASPSTTNSDFVLPDAASESPVAIAPKAASDCTLIPKPELATELESKPRLEPEFDYVPKFESTEPGPTFAKMLVILTMAFASSGALVYSMLINNWFGVDRFLH